MSFSSAPSAPVLAPAPEEADVDKTLLTEDRMRRQSAAGSSKNIVSSLASATSDENTQTRISKLLG